MTLVYTVLAVEFVFLLYFLGLHGTYLALNLISVMSLPRYVQSRVLDRYPQGHSEFDLPISVIAPAYNEQTCIVSSVRSLLQLSYSAFELVVVNDGSKDETLEVLIREFNLVSFPEAYRIRIPTKQVRGIYTSRDYPNLRVIDKENGGKADSLNAGINAARYPLFCAIDADSILMRDSLRAAVQPFLEDPRTIACGGAIRIANGCTVRGGFLERAGLPSNLLALFQVVEYLRAFLFGRIGWAPMNAVLVISGAFGVFHKETIVSVGGYRTNTVGEDMELVVRLHRLMIERGVPYRIAFIPDPVCWTEAPEDLKTLGNQRVRWQHGLGDSMRLHRSLFFKRGSGFVGWVAMPFMLLFEWLGPFIEAAGYIFVLVTFLLGYLSYAALVLFISFAIGFGLLVSVTSLLLEELSFHTYPKVRHILILCVAVLAENLGYRQINAYWRIKGLVKWVMGTRIEWGEMKRVATWQAETGSESESAR